MEEEFNIEFVIALSLSDTIYERKGTSKEAIDNIKAYEKKKVIDIIKEAIRVHTTYEVKVS